MSAAQPDVVLLSFVRRGEEEAVRDAVHRISRAVPGAHVVAIGTPISTPILHGLGVTDVMVYGAGASARRVVQAARARRPRAVAIVYSGPGVSGHLKLEMLALSLGVRRIYRFAPGGDARPTGRFRLLGSATAKSARAGISLAVGAAVCGAALCHLGLAQMLAGGRHAGRS